MERTDDALSLRDYIAVVRQQLRLIIAVALVVTLAGAGWFLLRTPQYRATAELELERVRTAQDISLGELLNPSTVVTDAEQAAARSLEVAERAAESLGRSDAGVLRSKVDVTVPEETRRVVFAATDPDPETAAAIADAFATAFISLRRDQALGSLTDVQAELDQRAAELRTEIDTVNDQITAAGGVPTAAPDEEPTDSTTATDEPTDQATATDEATEAPTEAPPPSPEVAGLLARRGALQNQLSEIVERSAELGTSAQTLTGFEAGFTQASVPENPVGTDWVNTLGVSFILGLALGIGLAFARDHFDDVLRDESDLKRATGGLPVLGRIPKVKGDGDRLASLADPSSHAAEAYRELSASVRFMLVARSGESRVGPDSRHGFGRSRSILVSSADIGDGKTSTAANLAVATARVGLRTILVDADLRRSTVAARFGLPRMLGLSDALLNGDAPDDYLVDVGVPSLSLLTAGTIPPNPTELLASPAMRAMHLELLEQADLVIYDSPAVLAVADTLEIGPFVDMGVIVGRVGATTRRRLQAAMERLRQVGTDLSGAVLNGVTQEAEGYYYTEYYADDAAADGGGGDRTAPDQRAAVPAGAVGAPAMTPAGEVASAHEVGTNGDGPVADDSVPEAPTAATVDPAWLREPPAAGDPEPSGTGPTLDTSDAHDPPDREDAERGATEEQPARDPAPAQAPTGSRTPPPPPPPTSSPEEWRGDQDWHSEDKWRDGAKSGLEEWLFDNL